MLIQECAWQGAWDTAGTQKMLAVDRTCKPVHVHHFIKPRTLTERDSWKPIFQRQELRPREVKTLTLNHTANNIQAKIWTQRNLALSSKLPNTPCDVVTSPDCSPG